MTTTVSKITEKNRCFGRFSVGGSFSRLGFADVNSLTGTIFRQIQLVRWLLSA